MDWLTLIFLAIVQGIAEFLPISSSGHLALGAFFLGLKEGQDELSITLHAGTLLSILVFYRQKIWALLAEDRRVIGMLIVGTIPVAVIGIFIKKIMPGMIGFDLMDGFPAALTAALMLPVTGLLLLGIPMQKRGENEYQSLTYGQVVVIGFFQAFALLPGISRSGSTIFAGIFTGLRSEAAATFSFLLAIPAIGGAMTLELKDVLENGSTTPVGMLVAGAVISFLVGWVSLTLLMKFVNKGKLHIFAFWVIPVGLITAIFLLRNYMLNAIQESETLVSWCLGGF